MAEKVRYVDGGPCDASGRCRWVEVWVGFRLAGTFKGYMRKVEDAYMTLYPFRIVFPDLVSADKKVIYLRELERR